MDLRPDDKKKKTKSIFNNNFKDGIFFKHV